MKIWDVEIWIVGSKEQPDYWEKWATTTVKAETIIDAIQKAEKAYKEDDWFKVEARGAELVREVDIE